MCGIGGVLLLPGQLAEEAPLRAMTSILQHRGPDANGVCLYRHFGCAHTRLSIVDLSSAGNQPFENDRYVLAYNGEIYNHIALRQELQQKGLQFQGSSDTATLFALLQVWGVEQTLRKCRGMFAFSFYDKADDVLYLCRDRFGIKPLVWKINGAGVFWASEAKALRCVTPLVPDPVRTLHSVASIGDHSAEYTVFKDVSQVPPGNYIVFKPGLAPIVKEYYSLPGQVSETVYRDLEKRSDVELTEMFLGHLKRSVGGMLMSDAPVGVFASGGIDSSAVAVLASPLLSDLKLFSADVIGPYSEIEDARQLANFIGRNLNIAPFEPNRMISDWARCTYHYEVPIVTHTNALPMAAVAALARAKNVKCVLTGEGSDELFYGYPRLLIARFKPLASFPLKLLQSAYALFPHLKRLAFGDNDSINDFIGLLAQGFERQRYRATAIAAYDFLPPKQRAEHYLTIQMFREHLLSLLHRNDRMGMIASIEARFPFLDEDLVRFGLNLPVKSKLKRTHRFHNWKHPFLEDKGIVREGVAGLLPKRLAKKPKLGFPMYGHKFVSVSPGFFRDGYVAELLGIHASTEDYLIKNQPSYFVAKLASVEVFGRLYALGHSNEQVTEHLARWVKIKSNC